MTDIVVIGAGMAGLVCAQRLRQAGYSVLVVEKSRGLGGRVATRRLHGTCADHGTCYLKPKGELLSNFVDILTNRQILQPWTDTLHELTLHSPLPTPHSPLPTPHISPTGMNAIAKFLAVGLSVIHNQRAIAIHLTSDRLWRLTLESSESEITAKAVVIAIPAPQALMLLSLSESILGTKFLEQLRGVEFAPSISVMAGYSPASQPLPSWKAVTFIDNPDLGWIGLDSSKRPNPQQPHFVVQSSADFARRYLDSEDLQPVGQQMLSIAGETLQIPWLKTPEWMQVHRWRYAFPINPLKQNYLAAETSLPLICCGDWCGGNFVSGAMDSGFDCATQVNNLLELRSLPGQDFLQAIVQ